MLPASQRVGTSINNPTVVVIDRNTSFKMSRRSSSSGRPELDSSDRSNCAPLHAAFSGVRNSCEMYLT